MNNSMVAHLWANEKKESARGSNFFFEGRSIYSYGYHFEVGRIVRNKCGKKAYLLNDKYYSSSTCKHQHCVRSAYQLAQRYFMLDIICLMMAAWLLSPVNWSLSKRLSRNTRRLEQACLIGMFGEYLEV